MSGVIGGGTSQLIAGLFKARGDTRQITAAGQLAEAAEKRWEREQEFERKKLTFDVLRDVSVRLIKAHAQQAAQYDAWHYERLDEFSKEKFDAIKAERYAAEVELGLMAPDLKADIDDARGALWKIDETDEAGLMSHEAWDSAIRSYEVEVELLEDAIRSLLVIGADLPHNQPQLNEATPEWKDQLNRILNSQPSKRS